MKKSLLGLLLLSILSCQKPKIKSTYILKIDRDELSAFTKHYESGSKIDTIKAFTDTDAYREAVITFYSNKIAEKMINYKVYKSNFFSITDKNGIDLGIKLSKKIKDSLVHIVQRSYEYQRAMSK